jgi:hypothetical protein
MDYKDRLFGNVTTGRFFDWETPEHNEFLVSIANSMPVRFIVDHNWSLVHPGRIVWDYKNGLLSQSAYTETYLRKLENRKDAIASEFAEICEISQYRKIVLLCWEPDGQFCHRHLLINFLQEQGLVYG